MALSASMCSKGLGKTKAILDQAQIDSNKARQESVLQHQSYCDTRSNREFSKSPTSSHGGNTKTQKQI